jgi:serine/threonine-protein kinase
MRDEPPPNRRVAVGDVLAGKYRVERIIGEGGMGVVVAATHLSLDTLVALKFITRDGGQAIPRFLREAKSAVRLKSEHVARVSDVGTLENGMPYMVMEYLEGRDLNAVLEASGPLLVHRDLKPHNLFLTAGVGGRPLVKVLDFGISKMMGAEHALTQSAEIVGTPTYMAPEQLRSAKDVDTRADIWAAGVILYELLTGHLPFEAETLPQLIARVMADPPTPPSAYRPDLPAALADAVLRCLRRSPDDRFRDAADLAAALAPFAPDWASAEAVLEVGRARPSGGNIDRIVVSAKQAGRDVSSTAWSATELAEPLPRKRRWTGAAVAGAAVLLSTTGVLTWRVTGKAALSTPSPAVTPSLVATATPISLASPTPPPVPSAVPSSEPLLPVATVPTRARAPAPNVNSSATLRPPVKTKLPTPTQVDDDFFKNRR